MRQVRRVKEPDPPVVDLPKEARPRKPVSGRRVLAYIGATVVSLVAAFFIWSSWLEAKKGRMEDNVREFYEAQLKEQDQTANFEAHLYESRRDEYVEFVQAAGPLESYQIETVVLQALGVSGGANVKTVRGGVTFNEHFFIGDDKTKFAFNAASDENGQRFEQSSLD